MPTWLIQALQRAEAPIPPWMDPTHEGYDADWMNRSRSLDAPVYVRLASGVVHPCLQRVILATWLQEFGGIIVAAPEQ